MLTITNESQNHEEIIKKEVIKNKILEKKSEYEFGKILGEGSYAVVKEIKNIKSNKRYAVKIYNKKKSNNLVILNEIKILKEINHDKIIKYIDDFEDEENFYIVMTKGSGKTLNHYYKENNNLLTNEKNIFKIFFQLVDCVKYLHSKNIFHRDLKLENIMINKKNGNLTLLDLGFSLKQNRPEKIEKLCGTPFYIAPEIFLKKEHFGGPVDCWALGVILFKISTNEFPFKGKDIKGIANNIIRGKLNYPNLSSELKDLISRLLLLDSNKRYNINNIIDHPWYQNNNINN